MTGMKCSACLSLLLVAVGSSACYVTQVAPPGEVRPAAWVSVDSRGGLSLHQTNVNATPVAVTCIAYHLEGSVRASRADSLWLERVVVREAGGPPSTCVTGRDYLAVLTTQSDVQVATVTLSPGRTFFAVVLAIPVALALAMLVSCTSPNGCF
jgi:hypothetical protein